MRTAQTILSVIQERGKQKQPLERVYKLLYKIKRSIAVEVC